MRACAALAAVLWRLGRHLEAVEHQRQLLRLNPRDNQMLRHRQTHWLLELESYDELEGAVRRLRRGPHPRFHLHAGAGGVRSSG
jgi:hypothetical protein